MYFNVALRARACAVRPRCTYPVSQRRAMRSPEFAALELIAELGFVSHASHIIYVAVCGVGATMMPVETFATSRTLCPQEEHLR